MRTCVAVGLFSASLIPFHATGQVFRDFEANTPGSQVMFSIPGAGGTTGPLINGATDASFVTNSVPAGNPDAGNNSYYITFQYAAANANNWLRENTSTGVTVGQNPKIDFDQSLVFDIYSDKPIYVALGVRETGSTVAIGANGGTTGAIEFIGAATKNAGGVPNPTRLVAANTWTTLRFDIPTEPSVAFTGSNGLTNRLGVIEHLAIVPLDPNDLGQYNIFLDNFEVSPVPEPGTAALLGGSLALFALWRAKRPRK